MSNLVGNPEDRVSHDAAHFIMLFLQVFKNSYIPRTLDQVINFERDFIHAQDGETDEVRSLICRKVPKFWDTRNLCCNLPKIQTKRPNLRVFYQKDANGKANSVDPDQTAPLGAV